MAEMYPPNTWKGERVQELKRFRPFNKETNSWAGIRYNLLVKGEEEVYNIRDEQGYQCSNHARLVEQQIKQEHYLLRRKFENCSPILTVQKTIKMFLARQRYLRKRRYVKLLYWCLNRWNLRQKLEKIIKNMDLTRASLDLHGKAR